MNSSPQDILLINPWITDFAAYDFWIKPMGLLYLAAVLRQAGFHPRLVDCMDRCHPELLKWQGLPQPQNRRWSTGKFLRMPIVKPAVYRDVPRLYCRYGMPEEIFDKLCFDGPAPQAILVTSGMTYWYPGVQMTIARLQRLFPQTPIVLGGIYATLRTDHAKRNSGADVVIAGEAEGVIVTAIEKALDETGIAVTEGQNTEHMFSLDDLPWPAFDLYPTLQFATIMTSRGCPLQCTFCASRLVSGSYRWRRIDGVMAELDWLHRGLGVREFAFYDDALLTNRDHHFLPLCERIINAKMHATFHTPNGLQAKFIDAKTAQLMWRAGFKTIRLAYESGSEERQRDMSRKVSNAGFAAAVGHLQAAGFAPRELEAYVLMALPGQSLAEILQSMAYVHSLGVGIRLAAFSPIPGTVDFARAVVRGDLAADADPLLANNSILPIRLPGTDIGIYYKISELAKALNAALPHCCGASKPCSAAPELASALARRLTENFLDVKVTGQYFKNCKNLAV